MSTPPSELLATQPGDPGWAQIRGRASDAYATGSAVVALHEAGTVTTADPAYRRGVAFLVHSQRNNGTWYVASRSKPFQRYFESGFPHGKDQFIVVAASGLGHGRAVVQVAGPCPQALTEFAARPEAATCVVHRPSLTRRLSAEIGPISSWFCGQE